MSKNNNTEKHLFYRLSADDVMGIISEKVKISAEQDVTQHFCCYLFWGKTNENPDKIILYNKPANFSYKDFIFKMSAYRVYKNADILLFIYPIHQSETAITLDLVMYNGAQFKIKYLHAENTKNFSNLTWGEHSSIYDSCDEETPVLFTTILKGDKHGRKTIFKRYEG